MLTHERLKELLDYNPKTGVFTWKVRISRCEEGRQAGSRDKDGYVIVRIARKDYKAHRLAYFYMTKEWPSGIMDHINRIRSDNRWINLRTVTEPLNLVNKSDLKNNTSGVKGVHWEKGRRKWVARLSSKVKKRFDTFEEAVRARKHWESEYMKGNYDHSIYQ
jgi:hypothetical protein